MDFLRLLNRTAQFNNKRFDHDAKLFENHSAEIAPAVTTGQSLPEQKRKPKKQKKTHNTISQLHHSDEVSIFGKLPGQHEAPLTPSPSATQFSSSPMDQRSHAIRSAHHIRAKGSDIPAPITDFVDLNLPKYLIDNVSEQWKAPTPIQMQAIPILTAGRELLAISPTGSGKTAAFMIPILSQLDSSQSGGFRAIIVSPTLELMQQTYRRFIRLSSGSGLGIHILSRANAASINDAGKRDILIATPKKLADLINTAHINMARVEFLIFDEGDCLWDKNGFIEQVDEILASCTNLKITRALFSATMPETIESLARTILRDPIRISIGEHADCASENVQQRLMFTGDESGKLLAIRNLFKEGVATPLLIFVQSKSRARQLFHQLKSENVKIGYIESDQTQAHRDEMVRRFRAGIVHALITTEVLARGIDFIGVNCVVNYDFPQSTVSYIHRIGRTGRAGRSGEAITFFTYDDCVLLRSIAGVLKRSKCDVPDWMMAMRQPNRSRVKERKTQPPKRKTIAKS